MADQEKPYVSYLLRLWLVQNQTQQVWRCSLENVQTGKRYGFASIEAMYQFLAEAVRNGSEGDGADVVEES